LSACGANFWIRAVGDPGAAPAPVSLVEPLGPLVVGGGDPVEPGVTVRGRVSQAGVEERSPHAGIAEGWIHEEVVHHQDAIGDQRVETGVEAGEALKPPIRVGDELYAAIRILVDKIEQGRDFRIAWIRGLVEGEVALDQLDQLRAILSFGRTNQHRASLASV
jgi:hypothetical protein